MQNKNANHSERNKLIEYIKSNDQFYSAVNFVSHTIEQLTVIKNGVEAIKLTDKKNDLPVLRNQIF